MRMRSNGRPSGSCWIFGFSAMDMHIMEERPWRDGLEENCNAPCYIDPENLRRFLAEVPSVHNGDESTLLFTPHGVEMTFNGRPVGIIRDPHFATAMLATFIGAEPPTSVEA
jgi:hypothetical protein